MRRAVVSVVLLVAIAALLAPGASAARVLPASAQPMQLSYELWTVTWMRAALKRSPQASTSLFMPRGGKCGFAYGKMWLLPTAFGPAITSAIGSTCTIPRGMNIFVPIAYDFGPGRKDYIHLVDTIPFDEFTDFPSLTVDGQALRHGYYIRTPIFTFTWPLPNAVGAPPGPATATADGYYAILAPLPPGTHTIRTSVRYLEPVRDGSVTFRLTVV